MRFTIEQVILQNEELFVWYKEALKIWNKIFEEIDVTKSENVDELAKKLTNWQLLFESKCGGRGIGQEIMVVSGMAQFYTTQYGFDVAFDQKYDNRFEKVKNIYEAFLRSLCSMEVKFAAEEVAKSYGIEEGE